MALDWTDRVDFQDVILADDVNTLAHAIQDVEEQAESLSEITNELEEGVDNEETKRKSLEFYGDSSIEPSDIFTFSVVSGFGEYAIVTGIRQGATIPSFEPIVIPYEYDDNGTVYPVDTIGEMAFKNQEDIRQVILPKTVKNIESRAFEGCTGMIDINLSNVEDIGTFAFKDCTGLTLLSFSEGINAIGGLSIGICYGCEGLNEIKLPRSVSSIQDTAFAECNRLEVVYYAGSQTEWSHIRVGTDNTSLLNATIYYDCTDGSGGDLTNYYTKTETDTLLSGKTSSSDVAASIESAISTHDSSSEAHADIRQDLSGKANVSEILLTDKSDNKTYLMTWRVENGYPVLAFTERS